MKTIGLIEQSRLCVSNFEKVLLAAAPWEIKGILFSEMLLVTSLIEYLDIDHVIESGRARGNSTEIIARTLSECKKTVRFDSIEFDKNSNDAVVAHSRVDASGFPAHLHYGDSFEVMPGLLMEPGNSKLVLIDGPKGIDAVELGLMALKMPNVKVVCIHDLHKDDVIVRGLIDELWPSIFSTDDSSFVDEFAYLDESCWTEHQKFHATKGWGPYKRGSRIMKSYGPTLVAMFNEVDPFIHIKATGVVAGIRRKMLYRRKLVHLVGRMIPKPFRDNSWMRKLANVISK